jgi:ribA/ribD-fused uncharacterized protein
MSGLKRASGDRNECTEPTEQMPKPKRQKKVIVDEPLIQFYSKSKNERYRVLSNFSAHLIIVKICLATDGWRIEIGEGGNYPFVGGTIDEPMSNIIIQSFPSVEAAFQACKYLYTENTNVNYELVKDQITALSVESNPAEAKRLGSKATFKRVGLTLDIQRWNSVAKQIMTALCVQKVKQHNDVRVCLKNTQDKELLHYTRGDNYWGGHISRLTGELVGENHLGKIFELIRKDPVIMCDGVDIE